MSTIPTITESEVLEENDKVLSAYADLNVKINDMSRQEKINRELGDYEPAKTPVADTIADTLRPSKKRLLQQIN
jgi:hypothetical protein